MHGFVAELGAFPHAIEPAAHDELVALTSHLPHVLANVDRQPGRRHARRGPRAARERRRLAPRHDADRRREPAASGATIFLDNADAVRAEPRRAPPPDRGGRGGARPARRRVHRRAGSARPRRTAAGCSTSPTATPARCSRVQVHVADRPNVLAEITQAFGAARINIARLRARPHLARAGRHADAARQRRGRGAAGRGAAREARATASSSRRCSMRVEPAARLDGHIAVPGDKSISHRARPARRDRRGRDARDAASAAPATPSRRSTAVRALGVEVERGRTSTTLVVHGVGLRGLAPAGGRSTAATPARSCACSRGILAGPGRAASSSSATSRSRARPMERVAEPLALMGARRSRRPTGTLPLVIDGARAARDRLRAPGRERAGEVGDPARRARRPRARRRCVEPSARPATTPS